ncbi:MAG: TonB-dependent receptor [Woeseiaceae bacterium]|nr:TonB-dependent receptor [Woeseiaceae bacterium]
MATGAALAIIAPQGAAAQATTGSRADGDQRIEEVTVTGTRSRARSVTDSPVAIESFGPEQLDLQAHGDLTENLKNLIPSFTATALTGDGSAFVRSTSLRGLPPDETLLLVNSKRRHRSALIQLFGAAMSAGAHASDMGPLPSIAFKRVEVLRDGASSQYGSDAIAGVINFILRDDAEGGEVQAQYGQFYEGELALKIAGNLGMTIGGSGFLNVSAEWLDQEQLHRGIQPAAAQAAIDMGIPNVGTDSPYSGDRLAQTWGRPENHGLRTAWNMGVPMGGSKELYMFGNWADTYGNYRFFYRAPGHSSLQPVPLDPTDADGDGIPGSDGDPDSAAEFAGNFCWCDTLTGGYTPYFEGFQIDFSNVVGVRGEFGNGILYDFSGSYGMNEQEYILNNSLNPTYGPNSPRKFRTGDLKEVDTSLNADFSWPAADDVNVAFGVEWREEEWTAFPGSTESWLAGPWAGISTLINPEDDSCGDPECFYSEPPNGSNGRVGFSTDVAGSFSRTNYSVYGDVEWDVSDVWLLQFALRFEDFEDFGTTTNGKIATRYNVTDAFTVRAAFSTGFRAPTPGQSNQQIIVTTFDTSSGAAVQVQQGTLPPTDPRLESLGGKALEPEEAVNVSVGFSADLTDNLTITADWYQVDVDDRIVKTLDIDVSGNPAFAGSGFRNVAFYTNGLETETTGFDIVATYDLDHSGGASTSFAMAWNHNDTEITKFNLVNGVQPVTDGTAFNIEENLPDNRAYLAVNHFRDKWAFTGRVNWYDEARDERDFPNADVVDAAATVDLEARYSYSDNLEIALGANNAFDQYPNKIPTRLANGLEYSRRTPFGYDGGMWYLKGTYTF